MGSASELEYHLLLAKDLEYLDSATHQSLHQCTTRVKRMLALLINKVDEARERARGAGA
jgi:four helix bundle protein